MSQSNLSAEEDSQMIRRLQAGDEDVLDEILQRLGPEVEAVLLREARGAFCATDMEDVLAEGLWRLWHYRNRSVGRPCSLRNWFFLLARCAMRDFVKSNSQKARKLERPESDDFYDAVVVGDPSARHEENEVVSECQRDLDEIFNRLDSGDRRIMNKWAQAGEGEAWASDLAAELGIPAGRIRVQRSRLHDRITAELARRGHAFQ